MVRIKTIPFNEQALTAAKGITQAIQYPSVYILSGLSLIHILQSGNGNSRLLCYNVSDLYQVKIYEKKGIEYENRSSIFRLLQEFSRQRANDGPAAAVRA